VIPGGGDASGGRPPSSGRVSGQITPPGHVGGVAERADHGDAGALARVGQRMRRTGTGTPNSVVTVVSASAA
jgi:hypothetical protein